MLLGGLFRMIRCIYTVFSCMRSLGLEVWDLFCWVKLLNVFCVLLR